MNNTPTPLADREAADVLAAIHGAGWFDPKKDAALRRAIELLRGQAAAGDAEPKRDREAARQRFADESFNCWLDEGVSDGGHTVWDMIGDVADAWAGWDARVSYDFQSRDDSFDFLAPTPSAVAALPGKWRQIEVSDEPASEFDLGYEQASHECADELSAALAAQGQATEGDTK